VSRSTRRPASLRAGSRSPSGNGVYQGNIVKIFSSPAKTELAAYRCEGDERGKPVLGLALIKGMTAGNGNSYENGRSWTPRDGRVPARSWQLQPDGKKLEVRGYLGISLFGRSQILERLPDNAMDPPALGPRPARQHRTRAEEIARRNRGCRNQGPTTPASPSSGSERSMLPAALQPSALNRRGSGLAAPESTAAVPPMRTTRTSPSAYQPPPPPVSDAGDDLDLRLGRRDEPRRLAMGRVCPGTATGSAGSSPRCEPLAADAQRRGGRAHHSRHPMSLRSPRRQPCSVGSCMVVTKNSVRAQKRGAEMRALPFELFRLGVARVRGYQSVAPL